MAPKRPLDTSLASSLPPSSVFTYRDQEVYRSNPIHDRSSTFVAVYSVAAVFKSSPELLQRHPDFEDASHRIVAWRRPSAQLGLGFSKVSGSSSQSSGDNGRVRCETGSDEDGEKYAGRKVEAVLEREEVEGVVVVARWYGGVMLGPVRFKWIEDCAGEAIRIFKSQGSARKRMKTDDGRSDSAENGKGAEESVDVDGANEREKLIKILGKRDSSIEALRTLLTTKTEKVQESPQPTKENVSERESKMESKDPVIDQPPSSGPVNQGLLDKKSVAQMKEVETSTSTTKPNIEPFGKSPDYTAMPTQRLKQLEKARDATIGWILKQIDAAEEKVKGDEEKSYKEVKAKAQGIWKCEKNEDEHR